MKVNPELLEKLKELTEKENKGFSLTLNKVAEEFGEVNSAWLKHQSVKSVSYKGFNPQELSEEVVDLFMCVYSLLVLSEELTEEDLNSVLEKKIEKWESKLKN